MNNRPKPHSLADSILRVHPALRDESSSSDEQSDATEVPPHVRSGSAPASQRPVSASVDDRVLVAESEDEAREDSPADEESAGDGETLLSRLDRRQSWVMAELDALTDRIEALILVCQHEREQAA